MKKFFLWITAVMGGFLLLALTLLAFVRIPIDLSDQKVFFEKAAEDTLGRKIVIDGKIIVTTSLTPSFSINDIRLLNHDGFEEKNFASIQSAKIRLSILPLLQGKLSIHEFSARGLSITLLEGEQGMNNWSTPNAERFPPPQQSQGQKRFIDTPGLASDSLVIEKLLLEDIALSFSSLDIPEPVTLTIEKCTGTAQPGKPAALTLNGAWQDHPFTSDIQIGSLQELLEQNRSWISVSTEIAATQFHFEGTVDMVTVLDSLNLKVEVRGAHLNSLNDLFKVNLLPLESYEAVAELTLRKKILNLNKLRIQVGDSLLEGSMVIDTKRERPDVKISMTVPLIQLNNFDLKDKNSEDPQTNPPERPDAADPVSPDGVPVAQESGLIHQLSQDAYKQFDAVMTLQLEKVYSGKDLVGGGILQASLQEGRFSIDPLKLDLPGGTLVLKMSLLPGQESSAASLSIKAENFDFGIVARRSNPETDMGGTLNLDVDLQSTGGSIEEILANGNGYIDFSARPENLNSGIMDLWVVNLLAAIITRSDKDGAPINCMISRWSMSDGVLTPDGFAVDTGIMRICGSGKIDLKNETLDIRVAPTPKRERFFSLATPFSLKGNIPDIKMGIAPGGLFGTSVRFVASPVTTPLSWLLSQKIPTDGADICSMSIGPENRPGKKLPGCR